MIEENSGSHSKKLEGANQVDVNESKTVDTSKKDSPVASLSLESSLSAEANKPSAKEKKEPLEMMTPILSPNCVSNCSPFPSPNFNYTNYSTPQQFFKPSNFLQNENQLKRPAHGIFPGSLGNANFHTPQYVVWPYDNCSNIQAETNLQRASRRSSYATDLSENNSEKSMENNWFPSNKNMLCFNPYKYGYNNSSQGLNPEEGYVFVYPYIPSYNFQATKNETKVKQSKAQKFNKALCC